MYGDYEFHLQALNLVMGQAAAAGLFSGGLLARSPRWGGWLAFFYFLLEVLLWLP